MYIIAFDPGSNFTGWAVVYEGKYITAGEEKDVKECLRRLYSISKDPFLHETVTVLVEGYQSGGYLTKEAKNTVGVVRTLTEMAGYWGFKVVVRPPQARLSAVSEAAKYKLPKDATAALAHALAYSRVHFGD